MSIYGILEGFLGGAGVLLILFAFPYVRRKVENVATKQDIGDITRIAETIKKDLQLEIERSKADFQLPFIAAEKRLEVHQGAYSRAVMMVVLASKREHSQADSKIIDECEDFYIENCLYLDRQIRPTFVKALRATRMLPQYRKLERNSESKALIVNLTRSVNGLPQTIENQFHIPPLRPHGAATVDAVPAPATE